MGLYINDKKKFLELCEDFYDNGNLFFVLGYDKDGNLKGEMNTNASEATLGQLLFDASRDKLFGCALNRYKDMERDNVAEEWGKFNGVIIPEGSFVDWEQRRYEIAKEVLPSVIAAVDKEHATLNIFDADANHDNPDYEYFKNTVEYAMVFADELIKQLKKASNED